MNVDYLGSKADVYWDLEMRPYPWADNSVDEIQAHHVLEHLDNFWICVEECARILKPGGLFEVHVPDESSSTALGFRDHRRVFTLDTWHGMVDSVPGDNSWALSVHGSVPLRLERYVQVPNPGMTWMMRWPFRRLLKFCAHHLRNFIWEQQFYFRKIGR